MKTYNIIFCGVGGQGLMLLSSILGRAAVNAGFDVMTGEQHGLSQRSGSIYVHFRIGKPISPIIPYGRADMMVAMEATEALRYIEYLKEGGVVIMSNRVMPSPIETAEIIKDMKHRKRYVTIEQIEERLRMITDRVVVLDSLGLAIAAGNPRTENSVLVGAASACEEFPIPQEQVHEAVISLVPPKTRDTNSKAFDLGIEAGHTCLKK